MSKILKRNWKFIEMLLGLDYFSRVVPDSTDNVMTIYFTVIFPPPFSPTADFYDFRILRILAPPRFIVNTTKLTFKPKTFKFKE